jgi:hypothetical protein
MVNKQRVKNFVLVKVKCTLVQALRLCTDHTAHKGSKGIALPFLDHGTRRGWGVSLTPRPLFTPGKDPVPIAQEAGWASGPAWTGAENLAPTGILFPDRPARSQSLYRLRYPAHKNVVLQNIYLLSLKSSYCSYSTFVTPRRIDFSSWCWEPLCTITCNTDERLKIVK